MLGNERFLPEPGNTRGWPRTRRQLEWALLVVRDGLPQSTAAKKVFGPGVSSRTPWELARNLRPFLLFLQEKKNALVEREFNVTTDRLLRESAAIALSDKTSYFRPVTIDGIERFIGKPPDELTDIQKIAVRSWSEAIVETDDGKMVDYRYRLHDKQASIEFLGKHMGMLSEKLMIQIMNKRQQDEIPDYSNVSQEDLDRAKQRLLEVKEMLADAQAIPGEATELTSAAE